ncbi:MAG: peptidoglycan endopeptidase [Oxalobacter sp.]|nr:MAG: peptidoglycan endopeptidase [Oxalobacter sp.]
MPHFLHTVVRTFLLGFSALTLIIASSCGGTSDKNKTEKTKTVSRTQTNKSSHKKRASRNERRNEVVRQAKALLNTNYKRGGNHPITGLDCSGYVRFVFRQAWGVVLPRTSLAQSKISKPIKRRELKKGDLVFYNTRRRKFSHVGIYIGNNQFIHSPASGGKVRIENMSMSYWKKRYNGARRVKDPMY